LLGRVRVPSVPRRLRSYWALRRLTFFGRRCGLPRCAAHLRLGASSEPAAGAPSTYGASEILVRLPVGLDYPRKGETLPGHWVVLLGRAAVSDPAERALTSPMPVVALLPSGHLIPWAFGKTVSRLYSRGPHPRVPTHHPGNIAAPEARLATGLPGWALAGQVSHLLDDGSEFHELPHGFNPFRPA